MRQLGRVALAAVAAVALLGCSGKSSTKQPVSGVVTWKGQPLGSGMIRFLPQDAAGGPKTEAVAVIEQGRYAVPRESGLDPGVYRVMVSSPDPKSGQGPPDAAPGDRGGYAAKERIPAKYNAQSKVTFEVRAGGENTFDLNID